MMVATRENKKMILGTIVYSGGQHQAAWRHPDAQADSAFDVEFYKNIARLSERAKFQFMFTADQLCIRSYKPEIMCRSAFTTFQFDPLIMFSALSTVTEKLGLIVTLSATYYPPYHIARHVAGLDLISGGRAGWNLVTSGLHNEALNHGLEGPPDHDERYEIGKEVAEIVAGLWASTEPGVVIGDKQTGLLFDESKIHRFQYKGRYRSIDGILSVPPSKQGRPIIVQAGASGPGRDLAASIADITFSMFGDMGTTKQYGDDLKARAAKFGRDPSHIKTVSNLVPVIAETKEAARAKLAELDGLIDIEFALSHLEVMLGGIDLTGYPLDGPLPADIPLTEGSQTMFEQTRLAAEREGLTIRQLANKMVRGLTSLIACGTAAEVADVMEQWFRAGATDGFLVSGNVMPQDLELFVEQVVPILQERGLFHTEYEGSTLRENLGLAIP